MRTDYSRDPELAKWGSGVSLHGSNPKPLMSALGQKQTSALVRAMSALCQQPTLRRARPVQCQPGLSGCIVVA